VVGGRGRASRTSLSNVDEGAAHADGSAAHPESHAGQPAGPLEMTALETARRKVFWRILPLCFVCYTVAYIDRVNVSLAKLTMARDLPAFDGEVFGFGAGVFFLGYFLLEIPSALIVEVWSARKWISRIMVSWGLLAASTALVKTPLQFYAVRFLLGLAEAGFFPGIIVYLTHWFPSRDRARAIATFLIATPTAQIVSPKISSLMLALSSTEVTESGVVRRPGPLGLQGWQWIFVGWGLPAVVLGVVVWFWLTDRPTDARWLTASERGALQGALDRDRIDAVAARRMKVADALRQPKVLWLALAYFLAVLANYSVEFFLPTILKSWYGLRLDTVTWLIMLPPVAALAGQVFSGWHSDLKRERRMHTVVPMLCAAAALMLVRSSGGHLALTVALFVIAAAGIKSYQPSFWALPSLVLKEAGAAGSIGLINSIGNLGGFVGPSMMGWVEHTTGSYAGGLAVLSTALILSAFIVLSLGVGRATPVAS
jgi:ACS family tartrate transporter-like MFS transporter